jgi:hypothetical protein
MARSMMNAAKVQADVNQDKRAGKQRTETLSIVSMSRKTMALTQDTSARNKEGGRLEFQLFTFKLGDHDVLRESETSTHQ